MRDTSSLTHEFVEYIPKKIEEGVLYISIPFETVVHKCCCGCGNKVVTPLSPTDWSLTFNGVSVSLHPSIGNWSFPCKSHYWIREDSVQWALPWSKEQIRAGRETDALMKGGYFREKEMETAETKPKAQASGRWWHRLARWFTRG